MLNKLKKQIKYLVDSYAFFVLKEMSSGKNYNS